MNKTSALLFTVLAFLCHGSAMAEAKPLKVYILAGQSNMEGQAKVETFDYIGDDPATAPCSRKCAAPMASRGCASGCGSRI